MTDHEVAGMQLRVNRGLSKKEAAHSAGDKHGNESDCEESERGESYFRAVERADHKQAYDRRGHGDD